MPAFSSFMEFLRSRGAFAAWLLSAALVFVIAWQALVGWPIHRRVTVPLKLGNENGISVYQGRVPTRLTFLEWNSPWVRIFVDRVEYRQCKGPDRLQVADFPASRMKGRSFELREDQFAKPPAECEVTVPWLPGPVGISWDAALFLALTALLGWARNPSLMHAWERLRRVPWTTILLGLVVAGALIIRTAGFSFPSWESDSNEYLRPVFQWLSGQKIWPTDRPLGFPIVSAAALRLFWDFRAVVVIGAVSSLCAMVALAWVFFQSARRLFGPGALRATVELAGVAAAVLFALNERIIRREGYLLPEALASLWLALQLWLCWRLLAGTLSRRRTLFEFGCFCAAGWAVYFTKSNWGFAIGMLPLPLLGTAWLRSVSRRDAATWLAWGAAVFLFVTGLAWGFQRLTPLNTELSVEIRSRVLICWHIDMVRLEIDRRLAAAPSKEEADLLHELAEAFDTELILTKEHGAGAYSTLGYDADRLYYHGFTKAKNFYSLSNRDRSVFCQSLFFGALKRHPGLYIRKVAREFALYFREPYAPALIQVHNLVNSRLASVAFVNDPRPDLQERLRASYRPVLDRADAVLSGPWPTPPRHALSLRINAAYIVLTPAFAWLLGVSVLLTLAAALWRPWRNAVPWRSIAPVLGLALWSIASGAACAFSSAALQALEIQRYVDLFFPLTLLAEFLWPCLAVALAVFGYRALRPAGQRDESFATTSAGSSSSAAVRAK